MSYPPPGPLPGPPAGRPPAYPSPAQPGPAWQPHMVVHPHPEPRSYPLMLRTWDYAWWKPILGVLLAVVTFFVVQMVLVVVLVAGAAFDSGPGTFSDKFTEAASLDTVTPWSMLYINLGLASLTLIAWFVERVVHRLRPRWLSSVLPGFRWKFFFVCS